MQSFLKISSIFIISLLFFACSLHYKSDKDLQNELDIANSCKNKSLKLEMSCYDLIAYKSSFANIRLGIYELKIGESKSAKNRFELAKESGNFYANALLANLYENGIAVKEDRVFAIKLLQEVEYKDPIAAYKISFYYFSNDNIKKGIKLLEFAAKSGVKEAQKELVLIYTNKQYVPENSEKSMYYDTLYQDKKEDFSVKIYGK
ncbi:sel1 repeat family protein [Aliarcobacter skirrowii]|uniref:tetratricopeptide repeat protein n=1 Tax=Aliarcobacter skirrowii TaxID=28200 RepID=UPI002A367D52|nr:sel1 repeat family protein [Aliarcobacter skirrowii]MDY0181309.1 sel1 repeat family protein [Aliarcobacter skirrowii]